MYPSSISEIYFKSINKYCLNPALTWNDQSWTYAELGDIVYSAMLKFKEKNKIDSNKRVAIIGDNHPGYVIVYFAAQCLGLSTVEVSRNESLDTLLHIVKETNVCFVVTDRDDLAKELGYIIPVILFQEIISLCKTPIDEIADLSTFNPGTDDNEASIVYTSGTTGTAKGVVLTHKNFCYITYTVADYLKLSEEDRYALILPLCHTYGKSILLSSFAAGAEVVMMSDYKNVKNILSQLSRTGATVFSTVPYHINLLLKVGSLSKYNLSSLRSITSASNKLSYDAITGLINQLPWVKIFIMYGLTEATTRVSYLPPEYLHTKKDSCGIPLPGIDIQIEGEDGSVLLNGQAGEVHVRGPNIMKGYFNDPILTDETVVNGWLKTGDLGFLDDDGFLHITGRKKDLIKCAGERISATEIENVLLKHDKVEEVAVVGRDDSFMGEIIHAYIVPGMGSLNKNELQRHCFMRLPHNKVPYYYTFVNKLPKTKTGKVKKYMLVDL